MEFELAIERNMDTGREHTGDHEIVDGTEDIIL